MQNNYYFLRQLSRILSTQVVGLQLATCFSQQKDELVLGFCSTADAPDREFYIKAVLNADFACLVFPDDFQRARRNSVDLLRELSGLKVTEVIQYLNERCFSLKFENDYTLLFKMHGNRSNLVLFKGDAVIELLHNKLVQDAQLSLDALHRPIEQTYEAFLRSGCQVPALFPTFGKIVIRYLKTLGFDAQPPEKQWEMIEQLLDQFNKSTFYITLIEGSPELSLLPIGEIIQELADPIQAANAFYYAYTRLDSLEKEKRDALRMLSRKKQKTENYLLKNYEKLEEMQAGNKHEQVANILMANLHAIPARAEVVELFNFYTNKPIRIKLKKDANPQKNAETYYRKAKNEKIEIAKLRENTEAKERELKRVEQYLVAIEAVESVKELRKYLKAEGLLNEAVKETPAELFKYYEHVGFEIWVGRNAKNNDLLTQKYAFKEDLWLHARDVTGSHVLIKYQSGKKFPVSVIEKAAQLAAYYSKRRTDSLCPVIVTPKKFVRKPKGLPEGAVVIDKEDVIMVQPSIE